MSRYRTLEALAIAAVLFGAATAIAWRLGLSPLMAAGAALGALVVLFLPLAAVVTDRLVPFYVARGLYDRALTLALAARDSEIKRSRRDVATVEIALIHLARGAFESALRNLRQVRASDLAPAARAVVLGHTAYCLAHLGREIDVAIAHAEAARSLLPAEWAFVYFDGLCRLKAGRAAEAAQLIRDSLAMDPNPDLPLPGERAYLLAQALRRLGDAAGAAEALAAARAAKGPFGDRARADSAASGGA